MTVSSEWPALWTKADASTLFEPWPTVAPRRSRADSACGLVPQPFVESPEAGTFLGRWGGYDVRTYRGGSGRDIGLLMVDVETGSELGYFPLIGIPPRPEGKACLDSALAVAKVLGLFADEFKHGPYGRLRDEEGR